MQRRVIQQSASSLGISLPAKWTAARGIKKGDSIDVLERGNTLVLQVPGSSTSRKLDLDITNLGHITKRIFDAIYKKGYDEVTVHYDKPEQFAPVLEAIANEAKSFEIVSQSKGTCVIRSISELDQTEFIDLLGRTTHLLAEMIRAIATALLEKDTAALKEAAQLEQTNNRFTHLLRRSLNRLEYQDQPNAMLLYTIIESLEKAADELKYLCAAVKKMPRSETITLASSAAELIEQFNLVFLQFTLTRAVEFATNYKAIERKAILLLEHGKDATVVHRILSMCSIVYDLLGPIVALRY